jgi:cell wall assembly regulator SMI1
VTTLRVGATMCRVAETPADLTIQILKEIRGELREIKDQQRGSQEQQLAFQQQTMSRFEVIETALRDLAQQLVVLGRGVKVAIEARGRVDERLEEHERRIDALERRVSG